MEVNNHRYADSITEMIDHCKQTLIDKHAEYAVGSNYHNFEQAAKLMNTDPRKALAGMMAKHTVSVYDLIESNEIAPRDQWKEKIGDHINYLLILWAMVNEEAGR